MSGIETGPSLTGLLSEAIERLTGHGHPLLAEAVRQSAERAEDLAADAEQLRAELADATEAAETWAAVHGELEEAAQNAEHYRGALQQIAKTTSDEDARRIAQGALR